VKIDRVLLLCYTGYPERAKRAYGVAAMAAQRLHVPCVDQIWQFPSPWEKWILDRAPHIPFLDTHPGCFGASVGHYRAIKTAAELGSQGALILEDDCRFRKGLDLAAALDAAPADADILMLDHFSDREAYGPAKDGWTRLRGAYSSACYAADAKALRALARCYEAPVTYEGCKFAQVVRTCDNYTHEDYLGRDCRIYAATPNLAVQCTCPTSNCGAKHCLGKYEKLGINLEDYDGYDEG
jgi:hypothetical protein